VVHSGSSRWIEGRIARPKTKVKIGKKKKKRGSTTKKKKEIDIGRMFAERAGNPTIERMKGAEEKKSSAGGIQFFQTQGKSTSPIQDSN